MNARRDDSQVYTLIVPPKVVPAAKCIRSEASFLYPVEVNFHNISRHSVRIADLKQHVTGTVVIHMDDVDGGVA